MKSNLINPFKVSFGTNRIFGLDILRASAIVFVVLGHGRYLLNHDFDFVHDIVLLDGVSLFFVLSGFLIGGIIIRSFETQELDQHFLLNFWIRRWFRTLPNYFLILSILLILGYNFDSTFQVVKPWQFWIFSQNLYFSPPAFFAESWSISIEEWFYVLLPLCLFFGIRLLKASRKQCLVWIIASFIVLGIMFRYVRFLQFPIEDVVGWDNNFRKLVITRMDSLMYGVLGAYLNYYYFHLWIKHKKKLFTIGCLVLFGINIGKNFGFIELTGVFNSVLFFSLESLSVLFLLPFLSQIKKGTGIIYRSITFISLISYSMYLINYSLLYGWFFERIPLFKVGDFIPWMMAFRYFLFLFLTVVISYLIYQFYEVPIMKLRDTSRVKNLTKPRLRK